MKKILMICLALVMGLGMCAAAGKPAQKKEVTTVFVTDIDREHCVKKIMNNVPSLGKGIKDVKVDLPKKEAARDAAKRLSGGKLATAPSPESGADDAPALAAVTAEQLTAALPGMAQTCLDAMQYGMVWAARLPVAVMPYPHSNGLEAAGVERADCHLRSARFVTPVGKQDVLDFYHARLRTGGQSVSHREVGGAHLLTASSATAGYLVRVRELDDGLVEVAVAARN